MVSSFKFPGFALIIVILPAFRCRKVVVVVHHQPAPACSSLWPYLFCQVDDRLVHLERKVGVLEQEKTLDTTVCTLTSLRRYLNCPKSGFDQFEVLDLLQALVRLAPTQAHQKAEKYAAALNEVQARLDSLNSSQLQHLMMDPSRAKIAKDAASILNFCDLSVWSVTGWI